MRGPLFIIHPPCVGSRFAASGSTPAKSSTQPSTSPHHFAAHLAIGRKSFSLRRTEPGFLRPPAKRGPEETGGRKGRPGESMPPRRRGGRTTSGRSPITGATASPARSVHTCVCVQISSVSPCSILLSSSPHGSDRPPVFPRLASTICSLTRSYIFFSHSKPLSGKKKI